MASNGTAMQVEMEQEFYRIGEVSRLTGVKPFVLRYWEEELPMLEPYKSPSGHRLYRQEDVNMIFRIKRLLYDEGFTLAGARRHLREGADPDGPPAGLTSGASAASNMDDVPQLLSRKMLLDLRDTLRAFLTLIERR